MFVKKDALEEETRDYLVDRLDKSFTYKEGNDLNSIINEVLNDRDIFTFLAIFSERGSGLRLGHISYFDDAILYTHYGLVLDFDKIPRRTKLFSFESFDELGFGKQDNLMFGFGIGGRGDRPSPDYFLRQVNHVLKNPEPYLLKLNLDKKKF